MAAANRAIDLTIYHARQPQTTPLFGLVQSHYADLREAWEERCEPRCGFWQRASENAVGVRIERRPQHRLDMR